MNAEITALVATWRKQADTHENYRHHLSDPYGDIGHVHEVKAKRLRMCADELERLAASRPAPAPSVPEPSPARAGYPYTEAGDRVMAERFPAAPPVGEAERLLRDGDASRLRNIADAMAGRVDWEFWQDAMVDMRAIAHAIDQVAALASPAPQPADGVTQAQHEIVASIIDMVEHDQSRRAEMNRLRADALRAVLARALASPAPPATNEHEQAAQQILVTLAPLVSDAAIVGRTYGWPEVLAVVNAAAKKLASPAPQPAAPAPVEPPDWMSERQADWQHGAPVEPPPALVDCPECHETCGWCSWYRKNAREAGCGSVSKNKCAWGQNARGVPCKTCDGSSRVMATTTYQRPPRLRGGGIISHAEIEDARKAQE